MTLIICGGKRIGHDSGIDFGVVARQFHKGTGLRDKAFLFSLFSAAAFASGVGLLMLDRVGVLEIGPAAEALPENSNLRSTLTVPAKSESTSIAIKGALLTPAYAATAPEQPFEVPQPQPARRFAYLPDGLLPLSTASLASLQEPEEDQDAVIEPVALTSESESPGFWVSETHREIAALEQKARASASSVVRALPPVTVPSMNASTSLESRLAEISPAAGARLREKFADAKVAWPPAEVSLVAIKDERVVELHARDAGGGAWHFVHSYPVLAASGGSGPKLKRGDKQVPEGVYAISFLNPNSRYHVALRVSYPNKFDRDMAAHDGRADLGGDIMIHGKNVSAGCLAMGDEAAEELFLLAARIGLPNIKVIIAPKDFRKEAPSQVAEGEQPRWVPELYTQVASAMSVYKRPSSGLLSFFGN
jgi:hypothetical protein